MVGNNVTIMSALPLATKKLGWQTSRRNKLSQFKRTALEPRSSPVIQQTRSNTLPYS